MTCENPACELCGAADDHDDRAAATTTTMIVAPDDPRGLLEYLPPIRRGEYD